MKHCGDNDCPFCEHKHTIDISNSHTLVIKKPPEVDIDITYDGKGKMFMEIKEGI